LSCALFVRVVAGCAGWWTATRVAAQCRRGRCRCPAQVSTQVPSARIAAKAMTGFRCGRCWAGATSERPGVRHDRGEVGSFWLPPQLALRSVAGGDEHRRVARSPGRRAADCAGMGCPVTCRQVSSTCRTEKLVTAAAATADRSGEPRPGQSNQTVTPRRWPLLRSSRDSLPADPSARRPRHRRVASGWCTHHDGDDQGTPTRPPPWCVWLRPGCSPPVFTNPRRLGGRCWTGDRSVNATSPRQSLRPGLRLCP
jgi:hypothetical protein